MSSALLVPLIEALAARGRTVFALDTPGYGESDPLPMEQPTAEDYADSLRATCDALRLETVDLWGSHTGGKIALAFPVRNPQRVRSF